MNDTMQIALSDTSGYAPLVPHHCYAPPSMCYRASRAFCKLNMHMLHDMRFAPSVCLQMA